MNISLFLLWSIRTSRANYLHLFHVSLKPLFHVCHSFYIILPLPWRVLKQLHSIQAVSIFTVTVIFMCSSFHANYDWWFFTRNMRNNLLLLRAKKTFDGIFFLLCIQTKVESLQVYCQWICVLLLFVWNEVYVHKNFFSFSLSFHNIQQVSFFLSSYIVPLFLISLLYVGMLARLWKTAPGCNPSAEAR